MNSPISISQLKNKLGDFISVENATSRNGMNKAPNQFILQYDNGSMLQSYKTPVAAWVNGELYLNAKSHAHSTTTNRFVKQYTNLTKPEREQGIADGSIKTFKNEK